MQKGKGDVGMAIIVTGFDEDGEFERAAAFGGEFGESRTAKSAGDSNKNGRPGNCRAAPTQHWCGQLFHCETVREVG